VWLKDFNWTSLLSKKMIAPYRPDPHNHANYDQKQAAAQDPWKDENAE
jgi:hypothetical protein